MPEPEDQTDADPEDLQTGGLSADSGLRLVQLARDGSATAQEQLYQQFTGPLRGFLSRRSGPRVLRAISLDDLCQETFLRSFQAIGVLSDDAGLDEFRGLLFRNGGWLIGKTLRKAERQQGESAIGKPMGVALAGAGASRSQGTVTRDDDALWLAALIDRLDAGQAAVLRERLAGAGFEEIAERLGISVEAARKRYLRGSSRLRALSEGA